MFKTAVPFLEPCILFFLICGHQQKVKKQHFKVNFWNWGPITIFHNMTCVYILKSQKHFTPVNNYTETYVTCFSRKWKISLNRFSCSYGAQIICFQTKNQNSRDTVPFNLPDSAESRKIQISLKIRQSAKPFGDANKKTKWDWLMPKDNMRKSRDTVFNAFILYLDNVPK